MKRSIAVLILALALALTACGGKTEADKGSSQNGKIQITFYLWDRSMMKELTPWLEQKFPEYEFNFIQGFNTMDYYRDLLNRAEQLPVQYPSAHQLRRVRGGH